MLWTQPLSRAFLPHASMQALLHMIEHDGLHPVHTGLVLQEELSSVSHLEYEMKTYSVT